MEEDYWCDNLSLIFDLWFSGLVRDFMGDEDSDEAFSRSICLRIAMRGLLFLIGVGGVCAGS